MERKQSFLESPVPSIYTIDSHKEWLAAGLDEIKLNTARMTLDVKSSGADKDFDAELGLQRWPSHPRNPVNWSAGRKWTIVFLMWAANIVTSIASTAFEPALPSILPDLGTNDSSLAPFTISIYIIGYCFGPLIISPASELYGRVSVLYPAFVLYCVSLVVCGTSSNIIVFIISRAFMGLAGIAFLICGRAVIADIIPKERRGLAITIITSAPTLGPPLGPIVGGSIAQYVGWRWIFWISLAMLGTLMIGFLLVLRETFPPILEARLRRELQIASTPGQSASARFAMACTRPLRFIFRTRLIPLFTIYTSILNSYLYILLATLGTTFQSVYGFSSRDSGLAYIGMLLGFFASEASLSIFSDMMMARRKDPKPEDRLRPLVIGSILLPCVLAMYGWSLEMHTHWVVPVIGSGLIGFATMYSYVPVQIYVVDVYTLHTASATGAMSMIRSAFSAIVPLGAEPLYARFGYGVGYTILAGIAVPFIGLGILLIKWGKTIREMDKKVE